MGISHTEQDKAPKREGVQDSPVIQAFEVVIVDSSGFGFHVPLPKGMVFLPESRLSVIDPVPVTGYPGPEQRAFLPEFYARLPVFQPVSKGVRLGPSLG